MIKMMTSYLGSVYPWIPSILGNVHEPSTKYLILERINSYYYLPPSTGRGLARGGGAHCGGECFNVMNIFRERIIYICNYIYTYLRIYIYAKVPAVETDGEKENDANGSE